MGMNDSPVYRASQDAVQTLLGIARLNQYREQFAAEERERQRKAGIEEEELGNKREDRAREEASRNQALGVIKKTGRMPISVAPPGPATGGAPFVSSPQDASAIDTSPQPFNYKDLLSALVTSQGVKTFADPQVANIAHGGGLLKSPEQVKLEAQAASRKENAQGVAELLQMFHPDLRDNPERALAIARSIDLRDADTVARLPIWKQQADTGMRGEDRRWAVENLETDKSKLGAKLTGARVSQSQAFTDWMNTRINESNTLLPERQKALSASTEAQQAKTEETKALLPGKVEGQRKKTAVIGTPKAGKPSELDKDAEIWRAQYLTSDDFSDTKPQSGYFGTSYGSTAGESRAEAARKDAMNEPNVTLRRIKMRAWELAFGKSLGAEGGKGGTATQKRVLRFDSQGNLLP